MDFKVYLWFIGLFIVGGIVFTMFGMQISITNNCALKLFALVKSETELWYADACLLYFKKVKRRNRLIILALFVMALFFVPLAGFAGLLVGFLFKRITCIKKAGLNQNNLSDTVSAFLKFAKPGKEEAFILVLDDAINSINTKNVYNCM